MLRRCRDRVPGTGRTSFRATWRVECCATLVAELACWEMGRLHPSARAACRWTHLSDETNKKKRINCREKLESPRPLLALGGGGVLVGGGRRQTKGDRCNNRIKGGFRGGRRRQTEVGGDQGRERFWVHAEAFIHRGDAWVHASGRLSTSTRKRNKRKTAGSGAMDHVANRARCRTSSGAHAMGVCGIYSPPVLSRRGPSLVEQLRSSFLV